MNRAIPARAAPLAAWRARRRRGIAALALLVLLSLGAMPAAQAATPAEYRQAVARALDVVAGAADADEAGQARAVAEAAAILGGAGTVELGNGQTLAPVDPALRAALDAGDLAAARAQLAALRAALDAAAGAPAAPRDAAEQLAAILARPEFQPPKPNVVERLLQPVLEPLRLAWERFWRGLLARLNAPSGDGSGVVFLVLGAVVVAGLGALLAGAFAGNVVSGAQTTAGCGGPRRGLAASRARAFELAAAGDYRAALHELHLATLLALDERRLLRFQPELTNHEHAAAGRVDPAIRPALARLVELYDRLWYSGAPVSADDWQRFASLADACVAAAGSRGPSTPPLEPRAEAPAT
ncbi:MAG TPA: DUF4129 domain-containing protein [Chloroflexota bacterium]|nr:DUF4129 domain-containing protein [Chloroflexota bacterium]